MVSYSVTLKPTTFNYREMLHLIKSWIILFLCLQNVIFTFYDIPLLGGKILTFNFHNLLQSPDERIISY